MIVGPDYDAVHKRLLDIEKRFSRMESNPAPTVPQYDLQGFTGGGPPPSSLYALTSAFKSHPHWWALDDTFADNTTLPRWFETWGAADVVSTLAVLSGSNYLPVAGGFLGFWTPDSHPPGYVGLTPTPLGSVGNGYGPVETGNFSDALYDATPITISSGDTLVWIGASTSNPDDIASDPYVDVSPCQIVDPVNPSTIIYDFGHIQIVTKDNDVTALINAVGNSNRPYPVGSVWEGPSWVVP